VDKQQVRLTVLLLIFVATFGGARAATRYRVAQQRTPDWHFVPYDMGKWRGVDGRFDPVYGTDPADSSMLRVYQREGEPPVVAYVGFFENLATVMEVHTPELCYPAQGWGIQSIGSNSAQSFRGVQIPARLIVADKNGDRRIVMWWYNAGSRPFKTRIRYVYAMLVMSAFTGRTDGSMVRLETTLGQDSEAAAIKRIEEFQVELLPALREALPQ
jgi:EpsI family protein